MISKLHYITQDLETHSHVELVELACRIGIDWIQLRMKNNTYNEVLEVAIKAQKICKSYKSKLIINDSIEIAQIIGADGVHLGKTDLPPILARSILGKNAIIGCTANNFDDIKRVRNYADYIGLGPFRYTDTKQKLSPLLGKSGIQEIIKECKKERIKLPIIAIGGILVEDIKNVMSTGTHGIAVASLINHAKDKKQIVQQIKSALK